MANVKDDDNETLDFADESEYIGCYGEDSEGSECPDCGVQLLPDGTVDALPGEPAEHYTGCKA